MATPSLELIDALRTTAHNIATGAPYQWGHMGSCNCGHLAQVLTSFTRAEIHAWALESREGDWSEQTAEYCPNSHIPMDKMIDALVAKGLSIEDLRHLEYLSDPLVLQQVSEKDKPLEYNRKEDVIKYIRAWASVLENHLQYENKRLSKPEYIL